MSLYKVAKHVLIAVLTIWCMTVSSSTLSDYESFLFHHSHRYIYTWDISSGQFGAMQQLKGSGRPFLSGVQPASETLEVMELKWSNDKKLTSSQMCVRRSGNELPVLEEIDKKNAIVFSYIGKKGPYDCFRIYFSDHLDETFVSVRYGYFEPSLTKKNVHNNGEDTESLISVDLYSRTLLLNQVRPNLNTSNIGHGSDDHTPSNLLTGDASSGSDDNDAPPKPRPGYYIPDIDVVIRPMLYEPVTPPETVPGSEDIAASISINIVADGHPYQLHLTREEWIMLVERNLHRSPFLLFRLARHQAAARFDRLLLLKELDIALNRGEEAQRISQLLSEYDETPPEKIYIHSWLAASCLHFLLQETGIQIIPASHEQYDPAEYLKNLEQQVQQLIQSKKLQQALADLDSTTESGDTGYNMLEQPTSIEAFSDAIGQWIVKQWKELLSLSLASIDQDFVSPTPTLTQASTNGTSTTTDTSSTSTHSISTSSSPLATPLPKNQKGNNEESNGEDNGEDNGEGNQENLSNEEHQQRVIREALDSIVKIEYSLVKNYRGYKAGTYVGTGFVVDAEKGIILTNRHLGTSAPVTARAIIGRTLQQNIALVPLYSDPVNDIGFYQYDPSELQLNRPKSLPLSPESASVGTEVYLIGSDLGEKASIFKSHLADLERSAPAYDFNSFYFLMAAVTSGGASGSPVINSKGQVVAINSGKLGQRGSVTAGALLLPVNQAKKALEILQRGEVAPRGSILTVFNFKPRDKLMEMQITPQSQDAIESAQCSGLLTIESVIPEGPADGLLENGDIVLRVNGDLACNFDVLVDQMNANVDASITLTIERNKETRDIVIPVRNAHHLDTSKLFEIAGGQFHEVGYNYARTYHIPLKGIYISHLGPYFDRGDLEPGNIIYTVDGEDTHSLDDFVTQMTKTQQGKGVLKRISYIKPGYNKVKQFTAITINHHFSPTTVFERKYRESHWTATQYSHETPSSFGAPQFVHKYKDDSITEKDRLAQSLVQVEIICPFPTALIPSDKKPLITGLVVDSQRGYVVIDSSRLMTPFADIRLIFPEAINVAATVFKQHPKLSMTLLKYDPGLINIPVRSVQFVDARMETGMTVRLADLDAFGRLKISNNQLSSPFREDIPLVAMPLRSEKERDRLTKPVNRMFCDACFVRDSHLGIVTNEQDKPIGWSIMGGRTNPTIITAGQLKEFVQATVNNHKGITDLGVGVNYLSEHEASLYGVPSKYIEAKPREKFSFIKVNSIDQTASAAEVFHTGDVILAVDDVHVYEFSDLKAQLQEKKEVTVTFLRASNVMTKQVKTKEYPFQEFRKIINWQGMVLHEPMRSFNVMTKLKHGCVYIADINAGSPAQKANAALNYCIASVDGQDTPDLETFLIEVKKRSSQDIIKLKIVGIQAEYMRHINIRPDHHYWYTTIYEQDDGGDWHMKFNSSQTDADQ